MSKISLTNLVNLTNQTTAVNAINANNAVLTTALDNTLSRDGTSPNTMSASLDMNSNRILNLPAPVNSLEPLRLAEVEMMTAFQVTSNLTAAVAAASASATAASGSATAASGSASAASGSATAASGSATAASGSATAAAASAVTAASYATSNILSIFSFLPGAEIAAIQAKTSTYDAGPVINSTLAANPGKPIYFPAGKYKIATQILYSDPDAVGLTDNAVQIFGAGMNETIFQNTIVGQTITSAFSTVIGSSTITVAATAHGKAVNDDVTFINLSSHNIGGCDFDSSWNITSVTTNTFTFNYFAAATSTVNNSGTATMTKPMMRITTAGAFAVGAILKDFQILGGIFTSSPLGSSSLTMKRQWNSLIDHVWFNGATADGLTYVCVRGDTDGPSETTITNCRINNCGRWGIQMAGGATVIAGVPTGFNEISNTTMKNCLIDSCGGSQTGYQYGGGMKWKGQGLHMSSLGFTVNTNCAIYIPGGAGLASGVTFDFLVLENNTGRNFVIEGLDTLCGQILECYNNDSFQSFTGLGLFAATSVVKNINIQASIIRATAGNNSYTAFVGSGGNLGTVRIYTPSFQNFGYAGQAQASGITFLT